MKNRHSWKVFIASSTDAVADGVTEQLVEALTAAGMTPKRWDAGSVFPAGGATIDSLLSVYEWADAAIFILHCDDLQVRSYRSKSPQPMTYVIGRDNVLFEYGLGIMALGKERCFGLYENRVRQISDLAGITNETYAYHETNSESLVRSCKNLSNSVREKLDAPSKIENGSIKIISSPTLWDGSESPYPPQGWNQRALYIGKEGARSWLQLASSEAYMPRHTAGQQNVALSNLCEKINPMPGIVVSLGCGDARTDKAVLHRLSKRTNKLIYLPVDLNETLVRNAIQQIRNIGVSVPVGFQCDFEDDGPVFLSRELSIYPKWPKLITLLGGTFTNLDESLLGFLDRIRNMLHDDDHFLFDATIQGVEYSTELDINVRAAGHSDIERDRVKERQWLVAHAVARLWGKSISDIVEHYDKVVDVVAEPDGEIEGTSTIITKVRLEELHKLVTHSTAFGYKSKRTLHEDRVYTMRRFNEKSLLDFIENQGFEVVNRSYFDQSKIARHEKLLDMGYFLCRRTRTT